MEIIIGKMSGFCPGVQNAIEEAEKRITSEQNLYCLGEIVHNPNVIEELEEKGIIFLETIEEVPKNANLLFRAHGVPKEYYAYAKNNRNKVFDCTCPKVLELHEKVSQYQKKYFVFYTGKPEKHETIGTISFVDNPNDIAIMENESDLDSAIKQFQKNKKKQAVLLSQTTFSVKKFKTISEKLQQEIGEKNLLIDQTICQATDKRQKETETIAKTVDCMIVIGGKNSSNSNKLYEIAKANCQNAFFVETAQELERSKLQNFQTIGVMAGASTPQSAIEEVENFLSKGKIWI